MMEETLQPFVEQLDKRLKIALRGVTDQREREDIFTELICDLTGDIEATLREMLTEHTS